MASIDTNSYRILRILRAIRENWTYLEIFIEANSDRDILGGCIIPDEIARRIKDYLGER